MNPKQAFSRTPLHVQVANRLRDEILTLEPGHRLESESRLAESLGVSILTLRQALSALAHEGIVERRHGSGTYVADLTAHRHVAIWSMFGSDMPASYFYMRVLRQLASIFDERGYRSRLFIYTEGRSDAVCAEFEQEVVRGRTVGAAFVSMAPVPRLLEILRGRAVPYVVTGDTAPYGVAIDIVKLVRDGVRHLLENGCRRIAFMGWHNLMVDRPTADRCLQALQGVLSEFRLEADDRWIRLAVPPGVAGAGWEQFREIWAARPEKPDGLLVTDDVLFRDVAMGILDSVIRVPDQLKVVTHTNKGSGIHYPFPVTALEIDPYEYTRALAEKLIQLIRKEPVAEPVQYVSARLLPSGAVEGQGSPVGPSAISRV